MQHTMSQLERDLLRNARHRLRLWIKDTTMRCEAVDFTAAQSVCMILTALTDELVHGFIKLEASREDFLTLMQQTFETNLRRKKRLEAEKNACE